MSKAEAQTQAEVLGHDMDGKEIVVGMTVRFDGQVKDAVKGATRKAVSIPDDLDPEEVLIAEMFAALNGRGEPLYLEDGTWVFAGDVRVVDTDHEFDDQYQELLKNQPVVSTTKQ